MLDLIAEGMIVRSQLEFTVESGASLENPQLSAAIRNLPQIGGKSEEPVTTEAVEDMEGEIRKSAVSAPPVVFELSLKAFNKDGIELTCEDLTFLRQLLPFDPYKRDTTLAQYKAIWHEAMQNESASHQKQNKGRYAANVWLREARNK